MERNKIDWQSLLLGTLAFALLAYTGLRAGLLSMTHDESSTYLNFIDTPLWECFYQPHCWNSANLHLLNTWLMQVFVDWFGPKEFWIRFPNVLGHALYLFTSILLLRRWIPAFWPRLAGFLLLNAHPYLLEFFSLGRGYGLACGCLMGSVYALYLYLEAGQRTYLIATLLGAVLAVLSNFTYLNYFACLGAVLGIWKLGQMSPWTSKFVWAKPDMDWFPWLALGGTALLLGAMLYFPIRYLGEIGEFEYGVSSLFETFRQLTWASLMGQGYLGNTTAPVLSGLSAVLAIGGMLTGLSRFRTESSPQNRFFFAVSVMAALLIPALILQRWWLGTEYLIHRKALIFIPMLGLPIVGWLGQGSGNREQGTGSRGQGIPILGTSLRSARSMEQGTRSRESRFSGLRFAQQGAGWLWGRLQLGLSVLMVAFFALHLSRTANLSQAREWHYDARTKDMMAFLQAELPPDQTAKLGVHWLFSHSAEFYRTTWKLEQIDPIPYEKELRTDLWYDFYYIRPEQAGQIHPAYEVWQKFGETGILYRRIRK